MSNGPPRASRYRAKRFAQSSRPPGTHISRRSTREGREDEQAALTSARLFTDYLRACRDERFAMSLLPPGRFLMPGNLAGSPALTFAPLELQPDGTAPDGSLWAMMRRRYEAYKDVVVRPFFRDHFARLDRQIVLVDALAAFNAGPEALHDLEAALAGILDCFRIGRSTFSARCSARGSTASCSLPPRPIICITRAMTAWRRCCGARSPKPPTAPNTPAPPIDVVALAAVRATREAQVARGREKLPSILGTPAPGETANGETFDGETEVATFPGDLPADPDELFKGAFRGLSSIRGRQGRLSLSALPAAAAGTGERRGAGAASHPP